MQIRWKAPRTGWLRTFVALGSLLTLFSTGVAHGQGAPTGFFTDPVLILNGGGHHSKVRSMVFSTLDGSQLLTGGMDKVIHVWNLDADRSGPARTIRPPNWRGSRGQVNAIALSPRDDGGNQRLLAVAGAGVLGVQGEILLFRYPGPTGQGTGDVEGQLPATAADGTTLPGHTGVVTSLAFTPDGRFLASASNDKTVRIWNIATRQQVAVLNQSTLEVNSLAIFAEGTRLVAGGNDGTLRLYDITIPAQPALISTAPPVLPFGVDPRIDPKTTFARTILTLAVSSDNRSVVVGTEGGALVRYNAANLGGAQYLPVVSTGPVEALTISPDGLRLATSMLARSLTVPNQFPTVTCVVEIRTMPDGQVQERRNVNNLVQALAFSPDSKRLVYSGGDSQSIFVKELAPGSPEADEIRGPGSSLWDVGIRADNNAIRFSRTRPAVAGQGVEYEYFDLRGRFFFNPGPNDPAYRHAASPEVGWTITPIDQYQFKFRNAQGQGWDRSLDPTNERRWWAYTVIPPGPGHPQPVAAVAADAGIVLWNLITGEKTRFFNGHEGPVYAIASSADGKWLITGSGDQTVRLWPLAGCDRPPPFGAKFAQRPDGAWVVTEVTPGGFADGIALKAGHLIESTLVSDYAEPVKFTPGSLLPGIDRESPTKMFTFYAGMPGEARRPNGTAPFQRAISKRDSPVLTLFPGIDRRWALWTPKGYYDSSADGDRKFLGWLTNRGTIAQLLAGTFDSIDKFAAKYRQPKAPGNVLDKLLDTADPLQDVAANPALPPADPTNSRLEVLAISPAVPVIGAVGPVPVTTPTLLVNYRAAASAGAALIRDAWVEINGRRVPNNINPIAAPVQVANGQVALPIGEERDLRVNLVAVDTMGVTRVQPLDLSNRTPPPLVPRKSRLEIVAIGAEEFNDKRFPSIQYAETDARELAPFLSSKLIDPATGARFQPGQVQNHLFLGRELAKAPLLACFDKFRTETRDKKLGPGDVVALVIESHFLDLHSKRLLATAEPDKGLQEPPSISATELADRLGELTKAGCRVVVLVDAIHEIKGAAWDNDIQEWVRQLQSNANALVFIASDHGPSSPNGDGHRIFAQAVLDVLKSKSAGRLRKPGSMMSLFDFDRTVTDTVLQQTGRRQHAQCYLPSTLSYPVSFLGP